MNHKEALFRLLKPYLLQQHEWALNQTTEKKYSAVSIILRNLTPISPKSRQIDTILNTEILLLQRIENGKIYSGEVCLPGGKCDQGESIFQTAVRETQEETGMQLGQKDLVGILSESFMAYRRITHSLYAYAATLPIKLNTEQISNYRWLPVRYFMSEEVYRPIIIPIESFSLLNQFQDSQAIKHFQWPAIDVGLNKNLYGLTLYILAYFMSRLEGSLKLTIQKLYEKESGLEKTPQRKQAVRLLKEEYLNLEKYQIIIKNLYFKSFTNLNIAWKEDCPLSNHEKEAAAQLFNAVMTKMFPERPKF